jgi:DNA-binding NtrC family response regulator
VSEPMTDQATLKDMLDAYERRIIEGALTASSGNQRRAAASLGLLPTTLHEKMKRLGLLKRSLPDLTDSRPGPGSDPRS